MRHEISGLQAKIGKLEGLLKQADPDGYYKEGTHAANVAKQKGLRLYNKDKAEEALRKRRKQEAVRSFYRSAGVVAVDHNQRFWATLQELSALHKGEDIYLLAVMKNVTSVRPMTVSKFLKYVRLGKKRQCIDQQAARKDNFILSG